MSFVPLHYVFSLKYIETPHCVNIFSDLEANNWILDKKTLINILVRDEAFFMDKGMRIYDEERNVYFKISDSFSLEISKENPQRILIALRTPGDPIKKKRVLQLEDDLNNLRRQLNWCKAQLITTPLSKQVSRMIHETSSEHDDEKLDCFPDLTFDKSRSKSKTIPFQEEISKSARSNSSYNSMQIVKNSSTSSVPSLKKFHSYNVGRMDEIPFDHYSSSNLSLPKKNKIDIAILYSDPLVKRNTKNGSLIPLTDPVNFERECMQIKKTLKSLEKEIHMTVGIATASNLIKILHRQPTILHFICHGDYSKQEQRFYLAFENDKAELEECDTFKLKKLLSNITSEKEGSLKMVFVNACHSEEVGKVFSDAGVPAVIAVQSELKIEDTVALEFADQFYHAIFKGKKMKEAVKIARNNTQAIKDHTVFTCCCAHKHKSNCKWYEEAMNDGYGVAHSSHIPTCACEHAQQHYHKSNCMWANEFLINYSDMDDVVCDGTSGIFACCCCPHLTHDESMKFLEIYKDDAKGEFEVFTESFNDGELYDHSSWEIGNAKFSGLKIFGRNSQIHRLYELLTSKNTRCVQISGEVGVGKTSLVQQTANYLYERNHFRDNIVYINLEKVKSLATFLNRIKLDYASIEKMCDFINSKEILFILDNCDMIIKFHGEKFGEKIILITNSTKHVKIVICTQIIHKFNADGFQAMTLPALEEGDAFQLLYYLTGDPVSRIILSGESQIREILQMVKRTPKSISSLAQKIREKRNLKAIIEELEEEKSVEECEENGFDEIKLNLKDLQLKNTETHDFLFFLSEFPSGITTKDLQIMAEVFQIIDNSWLKHLHNLIYSEDENILQREISNISGPTNEKENIFQLKAGQYYWFTISELDTTEGDISHFLIKPHQYVSSSIKEKCEGITDITLKAISYTRFLSQLIINKMREEKIYAEKIIECSEVSNEGLWEKKDYADSNYELLRNISTKGNYYDDFKAEKILSIHETNLLYVLDLDFDEIYSSLSVEAKKKFVNILLTVFRNIPTIFKMLGRYYEAKEHAETVTSIFEAPKIFSGHAKEIAIAKIQLNLFLCAIYLEDYYQATNMSNWNDDLDAQISLTEESMNECSISENTLALVEYELSLIRIFRDMQNFHKDHLSRVRSKSDSFRIKNEKENSKLSFTPSKDSICIQISIMKENLKKKGWDMKYPTMYSKLTILETECKPASRTLESNIISDLKNAIFHLARMKSEYLELRANKALVSYIMHCESDILLKEAKSVYCERAIVLAKSLKDNSLEAECTDLLNLLNIEIRKLYSNLFVFMRSNPLLKKHKGKIEPCSIYNYYNLNFRKEISQQFEKKRKKISLRLDILTIEDFKKNIDFGCKILYLSFTESSDSEIIFEGKNKEAIRVPFTEFPEKVLGGKDKKITSVDILIIAMSNSKRIAEFFHSMGIQRIIYFEFFGGNDFMNSYFQQMSMKEFSLTFTEEILEANTINESYKIAQDFMIQKIIGISSISDKKLFTEFVGIGAKLYPDNYEFHNILPFETEIESGDFEDISRIKVASNLPTYTDPFVGRNNSLHKGLKLLSENKPINVFGVSGSGKTSFVKVLGDFCLSKCMFPNGVFYFPIRRLQDNSLDLKDLMKESLGEVFAKRIQMYFNEKKMLIILDDYDLLFSKRDIYADHIISSLNENKIPYILVTQQRLEMDINFIEMGHLSSEEAINLLQTWAMVGPTIQGKHPWFEFPLKISKELISKIHRSDKHPKNLMKLLKELGVPRIYTQENKIGGIFDKKKLNKKVSSKYSHSNFANPSIIHLKKETSLGKRKGFDTTEDEKYEEEDSCSLRIHSQDEFEGNNSIDSLELSINESKSHESDNNTISSKSTIRRLARDKKSKKSAKKKKHLIYAESKKDKYLPHIPIVETPD